MDQQQTGDLVFEALAHAVDGNAAEAATALMTIGQASDNSVMYGVCCAIASAGTHALGLVYGDRAPKPGTTDMYVLQELEPGAIEADPPKAFAVRFLTAYANGDTDTCLALFDAALRASDDEYVSSVCALLADVAGIYRLALDR
ncbi:hypothetical protein J7E90_17030 [Streptomyces sp. ISL-111]|uniref:hypothetical protein n=1 Tax=Streptomyces sp. ISL-111 TaxID=2819175 RepID=UPI001BE6D3EA|nr:hypothetical protein [Streptomyces sp. ISL-111]MBT2379006.1 hypothetical protein [Streptomyces sp. ISL-111]